MRLNRQSSTGSNVESGKSSIQLRTPGTKDELFELKDRKERLVKELASAEGPRALLHPDMAVEYRERIDRLFEALQDERSWLTASDDIRSLVGHIVVSPGGGCDADLCLEGELLVGLGWYLK